MINLNLKPIITETTMKLAKQNWYTFGVQKDSNKNSLKKYIEEFFKVNVLAIKTINVKGKTKRSSKTRILRKLPDWKKVMVKLKADQKIEFFDISGA